MLLLTGGLVIFLLLVKPHISLDLPLIIHTNNSYSNKCLLIRDLINHWQASSIFILASNQILCRLEIKRFQQCLRRLLFVSCFDRNTSASTFRIPIKSVGLARNFLDLSEILHHPDSWDLNWLIVNDDSTKVNLTKPAFIPAFCEVILVKCHNNYHYELVELWQIHEEGELISDYWGNWSQELGLNAPLQKPYSRRLNLRGYRFQVGQMIGFREDPDEEYQRQMLDDFFAYAMNFTYNITHSPLGFMYPNGTKTGIYHLLREKEIDFTFVPFAVTPERILAMDFVWPSVVIKTKLFVAMETQDDWKSYLKPFDFHLWIALLFWIIFVSIVFSCLYRRTRSWRESLVEPFLQVIAPFCSQGNDAVLCHASLFIANILPYIAALILLSAYNAAILAFLTVHVDRIPFTDLKGLLEDGNHRLSYIPYTFPQIYFEIEEGEVPRAFRSKNLLPKDAEKPLTSKQGFTEMCNDQSLVFMDSVSAPDDITCHLATLSEPLFEQGIGFAVKDNFPYSTAMLLIMMKVHERGLKEFYHNPTAKKPAISPFKPIEMITVTPILMLLAVLFLLALFMLFLEFISAKFLYKNKTKHSLPG